MPRPEKHVFVCVQNRPAGHPRGSCAERSSPAIMEAFMAKLQANPALFGRIAVSSAGCLGPCPLGPTVLVYPEGVMYKEVTPADVDEIFEKHLVGNEPVQRLMMPPEMW